MNIGQILANKGVVANAAPSNQASQTPAPVAAQSKLPQTPAPESKPETPVQETQPTQNAGFSIMKLNTSSAIQAKASNAISTASSLFADVMKAAASVSAKAEEAVAKSGGDIDTTTSTHDDIRDKIHRMRRMMDEQHPGMVNFINQIHEICISRHDLVAQLSDEEIGEIVSGLALVKDIVITKETVKKASGKRSLKNVGVDDI